MGKREGGRGEGAGAAAKENVVGEGMVVEVVIVGN